jgi:hypothetical protein
MNITFTKRTGAGDSWADNKNNHACAQWSLMADGVEVGFITGRAGNYTRSAAWSAYLFGARTDTREVVVAGRATIRVNYPTLKDLKAALVAEWTR